MSSVSYYFSSVSWDPTGHILIFPHRALSCGARLHALTACWAGTIPLHCTFIPYSVFQFAFYWGEEKHEIHVRHLAVNALGGFQCSACFFRLLSNSLLILGFAFLGVHWNLKAFASAVCILGIICPWLVLGLLSSQFENLSVAVCLENPLLPPDFE